MRESKLLNSHTAPCQRAPGGVVAAGHCPRCGRWVGSKITRRGATCRYDGAVYGWDGVHCGFMWNRKFYTLDEAKVQFGNLARARFS